MAGDGWRTRHDSIKWLIAQQASWAMFQMRVEPNNLFLPWIKQRDDFMRDQKARKRQGLIPDFLDVQRQVLMDVKGCSYCPTRYGAKHFRDAKTCHAVLVRQREVNHQKGKFRIPKPKGGGKPLHTGLDKTRICVFPLLLFLGFCWVSNFVLLVFKNNTAGFSKPKLQKHRLVKTQRRILNTKRQNTDQSTKHRPVCKN